MKNTAMKHIIKLATVVALLVAFTPAMAQNDTTATGLEVKPEVFYILDAGGNAFGGLRTGFGVSGYGVTGVEISHSALKNIKLVTSMGLTHGGIVSERFLGDVQWADNIAAGNHVFLNELNLQGQFGGLSLTLGMQDLCDAFAITEKADVFLNSSFGIHAAIAGNCDLPIFPLLGWGVTTDYHFNEHFHGGVGFYDTPLNFDENPYNLQFDMNPEKGFLAITEWHYHANFGNGLLGNYKVGFHYHTGEQLCGYHVSLSQAVWAKGHSALSLFALWGHSSNKAAFIRSNIQGGVTFDGLFCPDGSDRLGLAFTSAVVNNEAGEIQGTETAIELTYSCYISDYIKLQPDVQYIIHPSGTTALKNPLFYALRLIFEYE